MTGEGKHGMSDTEDALQSAALEYAGYGWRVVPLHSPLNGGCSCTKGMSCSSAGKHPRVKAWQIEASSDAFKVAEWWKKWPAANVGVAFGEASGLIDLEADNAQAEADYAMLFDGNPPVTCCFQASRGKHRLFRWRGDLPAGAVLHFGKLEVRTGQGKLGAQSVFPPSWHASGKRYQWLVSPQDAPPAELTEAAMAKLWNLCGEELPKARRPDGTAVLGGDARPPEHWDRILGGVQEGTRNDDMASLIGRLLRQAANLDDSTTVQILYSAAEAINARNRPPLDDAELRSIFTSLLKREGCARATDASRGILREHPEQQVAAAANGKQGGDTTTGKGGSTHAPAPAPAACGDMRLVIVRADPPLYELYAPQFAKAERGCILLTGEQLASARAIRVQALKQADYPLPRAFAKAWDGTARELGLYDRLVFNATERAAPLEQHRLRVVADRLRAKVAKPRVLSEGQEPDPRGRPSRLPDGSVVFNFTTVFGDLALEADHVTRPELSQVLEHVRATWYDHKRFKRLSPASLAGLDAFIEGGLTEESPQKTEDGYGERSTARGTGGPI